MFGLTENEANFRTDSTGSEWKKSIMTTRRLCTFPNKQYRLCCTSIPERSFIMEGHILFALFFTHWAGRVMLSKKFRLRQCGKWEEKMKNKVRIFFWPDQKTSHLRSFRGQTGRACCIIHFWRGLLRRENLRRRFKKVSADFGVVRVASIILEGVPGASHRHTYRVWKKMITRFSSSSR